MEAGPRCAMVASIGVGAVRNHDCWCAPASRHGTGAATATSLLLHLPRAHGTRRPSCGRDIFGCCVMGPSLATGGRTCVIVKFDENWQRTSDGRRRFFVQATDKLFHK